MSVYFRPVEYPRPLPRGTMDFCDEPSSLLPGGNIIEGEGGESIEGEGGEQILGEVSAGATTFGARWACWVASSGIRFAIFTGQILDDVAGQVNPWFTSGERPAKVTMCFDAASQPLIAIQANATQIIVKGNGVNVTFNGLSPLLWNNADVTAASAAPGTDQILFYIKSNDLNLYGRFAVDAFAVEYTLATLPVTLRELTKTDITGGYYQSIFALTTDGRQVFIVSGSYHA